MDVIGPEVGARSGTRTATPMALGPSKSMAAKRSEQLGWCSRVLAFGVLVDAGGMHFFASYKVGGSKYDKDAVKEIIASYSVAVPFLF